MDKIIYYIRYILLFCILIIPLVFDTSGFYGYVVPKALIFQVSVLCLGAIWVFSGASFTTVLYNKLSISIFIFGVISLIFNVLSYDSLFSIGATFERMEGAINTLLICLLFGVLVQLLRENKVQQYSIAVMIMIALSVAVYGIISNQNTAGRLISTIGNPAFLCFYLANNLFLLMIYYDKFNPKYKWVLLVGAIIFLWVILQTLTRTFYIAMGASLLVMLVLYFVKVASKQKRIKTGIFLVSVVFVGLSSLFFIFKTPWAKATLPVDRLLNTSTLDARFWVWEIAVEGFKDKWFLGWGQENFSYVYTKFFNPLLAGDNVWYDRSHNVFLDWFVAGGIIGGLSFLAIWISALWIIWGSDINRIHKIILTGWVVFYCCFIFFNPDSLVNTIFAIFILAYTFSISKKRILRLDFLNKWGYSLKLLGVGFLLTILYQFTYQNIRSYRSFSKAIAEPTIENLIELSKKTYAIRSAVNLNMIEQLTFMHQIVIQSQLSPEQKNYYTTSISNLLNNEIKRHPYSVKLLELKSIIEINTNDLQNGDATLNNILALSPNYTSAYMQKGRIALSQGRYNDAISYYDTIIKSSPNYTPAKLFKIFAQNLKDNTYDLRIGLKEIPQIDLANNISLVREIFQKSGKSKEFVQWIWDGNLMDIFMPKDVYSEWISVAFQNGDMYGLSRILKIYSENYGCNSYLIEKIEVDAKQGIPPNELLNELFLECPKPK